MKKLSEQLLEMSQRTAAWEKWAAADDARVQKEIEADVAEARKAVQSAQAAFDARLNSTEASTSSQWREVQKSFDNQVATARSKAAEGKAALDVTIARERANDTGAYAETAAEFARMAAAEANAAMIEATQARAYAKSLEETTPSSSATPKQTNA